MNKDIIKTKITSEKRTDINIPNEPFQLFGRLIPSFINGSWQYETEYFEQNQNSSMCFPDESYDFNELSKNSIIIGAYDCKKCIGLAILQHAWNKFMYLSDLKVNNQYRVHRIASLLIKDCKEISTENGFIGIHSVSRPG